MLIWNKRMLLVWTVGKVALQSLNVNSHDYVRMVIFLLLANKCHPLSSFPRYTIANNNNGNLGSSLSEREVCSLA